MDRLPEPHAARATPRSSRSRVSRSGRERPGSAPARWYNLRPMDITALQETLRKFAAELLRLAENASIPLHAGAGDKTHVLVDWENVQPNEADCRALVPDATDVWLFHGPNQKNIGRGYETFGERVTPVRIARTGKNALDFHLAFYMGYIAAKHPGSRLVVLSNDKGYGPMLDHAKELGFVTSQSGFGKVKPARPPRKAAVKKTGAKKAPLRKAATPIPTARKSAAKKSATAPKRTAAKKAAPAHKPPAATSPAAPAKTLPAPVETTAPRAKTSRAATKKSFDQVLAILRKTPAGTLPSKRARLLAFVRSRIGADSDVDAQAMLERLEDEGKIAIDDKWNVQYRL